MPSTKGSKTRPGLPDELDIFSTVWKIVYSDSPYEIGEARACANPLFGECNYIDRTISVYAGDRSTPDIWKTILHEILHAVINEMGLHDIEEMAAYEGVVDSLSIAIIDIIIRNKLDLLKN